MKASFVFILLVMCLQYVSVTVFKGSVTYLVSFFRSRSYPVPHRGEGVKQKAVPAHSWNQNYSNWKVPHFLYFLSIASIRVYSV
jgi:hypothetical protein